MKYSLWKMILRSAESETGSAPPAEGGATEGAAPSSFLSNATPGQGTPPADTPAVPTAAVTGGEAPAPSDGATGAGTEGTEAPAGTEAPILDVSSLTLPEGFELGEEHRTGFAEILNNAELTPQERGQKLIDMHFDMAQRAAAAQMDASRQLWETTQEQWRQAVAELPEFKGKVDSELGAIKQTLISLGAGDDFFQALDLTGFGNTPAGLKMFHTLTKPFREGGAVGGGTVTPKTYGPGERMFKTKE